MVSETSESEKVAGKEVAGIPELVEMILLQLPIKDVLLAQRVDRTWHGVITGSSKLQQALFMKPCSNQKAYLTHGRIAVGSCSSYNDCHVGTWVVRTEGGPFPSRWTFDGEDQVKVLLNPVLQHLHGAGSSTLRYAANFTQGNQGNAAFARPEASWKKMLLTQPPLSKAMVAHGKAMHWHLLKPSCPDTGVTMDNWHQQMTAFNAKPNKVGLFGAEHDEERSEDMTAQEWLDSFHREEGLKSGE